MRQVIVLERGTAKSSWPTEDVLGLGSGTDGLKMTSESRFAGIGAYLYGEYTVSGYLELRSDF
jgi:hypothetical protein